jgi:hypothetical protein
MPRNLDSFNKCSAGTRTVPRSHVSMVSPETPSFLARSSCVRFSARRLPSVRRPICRSIGVINSSAFRHGPMTAATWIVRTAPGVLVGSGGSCANAEAERARLRMSEQAAYSYSPLPIHRVLSGIEAASERPTSQETAIPLSTGYTLPVIFRNTAMAMFSGSINPIRCAAAIFATRGSPASELPRTRSVIAAAGAMASSIRY